MARSQFVRNLGSYLSAAILGYEVNEIIDGDDQKVTTIERYSPNAYTEIMTKTQKTEISGMDILILAIIAFLIIIAISFYIIRLLKKNAENNTDNNTEQQEMELPQIGRMDV